MAAAVAVADPHGTLLVVVEEEDSVQEFLLLLLEVQEIVQKVPFLLV